MLNLAPQIEIREAFEVDTYTWFNSIRHGHMEKWQYMEPQHEGDIVQASKLWDKWEQEASKGDNMLNRQGQIIKEQINDMAGLTKPCHTLIDLGPGGINAISKNTVPFIDGYKQELNNYIAIDVTEEAAVNASNYIQSINSNIKTHALHEDFLNTDLTISHEEKAIALIMGGTIGNIEAKPNTPDAIGLMANRITQLKRSLPDGTIILIGLEATQTPEILYGDYDHPAHAEFEINIMHAIKRDLLSEEDGFDPYAWKYSMKWYPEAHQFCHIAEATELQRFEMMGQDMRFAKGSQLIIDNSFKFPVLAMQRSAQLANTEYLKPFSDPEGRMVIHAIQL
jgi:uncharacterized SAM-dependent methyltransferase